MLSVYTTLFNVIKNSFPWEDNVENFTKFADEVVIAVNKSEDDTLSIVNFFAKDHPNVKVVETNYKYDNIAFDGLVKDAALQATTQPVCIQMDADETFVHSQKPKWEYYAKELLNSSFDCYMVPSIDLYGSIDKIRANQRIGLKFRMHKRGLKRGIWKAAWRGEKIDTGMSDTTELINQNNDLCNATSIVPEQSLFPIFNSELNKYIYTVHLGFLSFDHRISINKSLWAAHWELRSGHKENVATDLFSLENVPTIKHNLILD